MTLVSMGAVRDCRVYMAFVKVAARAPAISQGDRREVSIPNKFGRGQMICRKQCNNSSSQRW